MTENIENADSLNGDNDEIIETDENNDDIGALKENFTKLQEQNRKLFARAKKAEGFEFKGDKWVKKETQVVEPKNEPNAKSDDKLLARLEKLALSQSGITHVDDIELARSTAKKWNMEIEEVLTDDDFKLKLERQQTNRANIEATTKVRGNSSSPSKAKESPDYWIAKGVPPTPDDIPDRKVRSKIIRAMMDKSKTSGKTFYND